ncbi:AAA family ATPase, partial [Chloroflexota bacterium]
MDTQAQMQAIVDKLSGAGAEPPPLNAFDLPWRAIYHRIARAGNFTEAELQLYRATRDIEDGSWLAKELTDMLPPGDTFTAYPSLEEIKRDFADVRWLWPSWIPRGMVTLLGAAPGMGKSLLALDLARRIITGEPWPDGQPGLPQAQHTGNRAVIIDAEGAPALLNQRARDWHLDRRRLFLLLARQDAPLIDLASPAHQQLLLEMCRTLEPALVVVDSLAAATTHGETSIEGARAILGFLSTVAREYDLGLLVIHHLRKRASGARPNYRPAADDLRGSSHLSAAARSVLVLSMAPPAAADALGPAGPEASVSTAQQAALRGPVGTGPRRLEVVKTNLCQLPPPLQVVLEPGDSAGQGVAPAEGVDGARAGSRVRH